MYITHFHNPPLHPQGLGAAVDIHLQTTNNQMNMSV